MLDSHLENGYHLDHNGEGCFGIESKNISMNHIATLHTFDTLNDFDPYDINLIFKDAYYYLLRYYLNRLRHPRVPPGY